METFILELGKAAGIMVLLAAVGWFVFWIAEK